MICCVCGKEQCSLFLRQFHRFPTDADRRQKWFNSIGRNINAYKNARVCSDHFIEDNYYYCGTSVYGKRLNKTAIPSVFTQRSNRFHKNVKKSSTNNIENVNVEDSSISNIENANVEDSSTSNIENVNVEDSSISNIENANVEDSSTSNIENVNVEDSSISNIENANVEDSSTSNIININEPLKDLQHHNAICVEPLFLTENVISTERKHNINKMQRIHTQIDENYKVLLRKTDFTSVEAWIKFLKIIKYHRYVQKHFTRLKKEVSTLESAIHTLQSKNLVTKDILNTLKNCANVKTNISSGIQQTTATNQPTNPTNHLLEEEERLQLSSEHDVRTEHNVDLKPINITVNSLQPSIVIFSTNNSSMTNPKIAVTAESSDVVNHKEIQLPPSQGIHKITQTTKDLSAHTPRKLKLQKENRILKRRNAALREIMKIMSDLTENQFLKACEKFLSPQVALFVREQVLSGKKKVQDP